MSEFLDSNLFSYLVLPLLIFCARIADVSLGTVRIIFVSKGMRYIAPIIGFFESLIWIVAISKLMQNFDNWICYAAWAAGFAAGNYLGIVLEGRLALGHEMIRVITRADATQLIAQLRSEGYGVTNVRAEGAEGDVGVIFIVVRRSNAGHVIGLIKNFNPKAFYTIEDIRFVNSEILQKRVSPPGKRWLEF